MKREEVYLETVGPRPAPSLFKRVSWGAIFAGLFVTMVIQFMLTLLGVAIGAATIDPLHERNPAEGLATGSMIWLVASGLISTFVGAFFAGRLSGGPRRADGLLHGIVTWSAMTLTTIFLLASATGAVLGGLGTLIGGAIRTGSQMDQSQSGQSPLAGITEKVKQQANSVLPPTGREGSSGQLTDLARQDGELAAALAKMEKNGGAAASQTDKDQVINLLTSKHSMDRQQAESQVTQWDQQFQQARGQVEEKARQTGAVAAKNVSKGALWGFIGLLLGMIVAAWGGWAGTGSLPRRVEQPANPA
jgi:hypothetical protein